MSKLRVVSVKKVLCIRARINTTTSASRLIVVCIRGTL